MTENYKILAKYIKDMSSETNNVETYLFVKENISNYQLNIDAKNTELKKINADFWIFVTNKEESEKILESSFTKSLDLSQAIQENNQLSLSFKDSVKLKRYEYDQGIKIFLSLN